MTSTLDSDKLRDRAIGLADFGGFRDPRCCACPRLSARLPKFRDRSLLPASVLS